MCSGSCAARWVTTPTTIFRTTPKLPHGGKTPDFMSETTNPSATTPAVAYSDLFCLSIRQPWAWLILNSGKDIENRTWPTRFRGRVLIHAGKGMTRAEFDDAMDFIALNAGIPLDFSEPEFDQLQRGGIVGEAEIVDCVTQSPSPWFVGEYGFVLRNAKPLPFEPCKGALGFFKPNRQNSLR